MPTTPARAPALLPPGQHGPARGRRERRAPAPPPSRPRGQRPRPPGHTRPDGRRRAGRRDHRDAARRRGRFPALSDPVGDGGGAAQVSRDVPVPLLRVLLAPEPTSSRTSTTPAATSSSATASSPPAYAKRAGGYLVVRPRVVGNKAIDLASKDKKPRRYPIDLETTSFSRDEFTIELPEGWTAESLPKPVALDAGFASYSSRTEAAGRTLVYRREYRLIEPLLPASRHEEALKFFLAVGAEEQQSLLLKTAETRRP